MSSSLRSRVALAGSFVLAAAALLPACTSSGGGGSPPPGTPSSTQPPSTASGSYVNPAWQDPAFSPRVVWPANPTPPTTLADWFYAHSWLTDLSLWSSYMRQGMQPSRDFLGAYGVGNGRVFGLVGLSYPLNTLHGMMGPSYQLSSNGYFGDLSLGLELYPRTIAFAEEWAWKPRRSAVTVTKSRADQVEMYSVDYAPPGVDAILRTVVVRNPSPTNWLTEVNVVARLQGGIAAEGRRLTQTRGDRKLTVGATGSPFAPTVAGDKVRVSIGSIPPGGERTALVYCVISKNDPARLATIQLLETPGAADQLLDATRGYWSAFFGAGASFELPDPKVQDWIDDMTATVAVQIAENGCATPMSRYSKTWMRDQEGALRVFLRTGRPDLVRRMLDAYYKTSILSGGIFNSMDVGLDVSQAGAAPDWMTAQFMPARNPVEGPSYIPIELYDYYRATGDDTILREQYEYAKAAVLRQERSPENLMRFNGDEPFRWVMTVALGLYEPENLAWSSESSFLFVAAAERMAKIATLLGKTSDAQTFQYLADEVRAAIERYFWLPQQGFYDVARLFYGLVPVGKPFEDISLMPLRIGYGDAHHPNLRQNLLTVKRMLGTADGLVQSPAIINGTAAYDGMVPGYYLQNLTIIDHADAEKTFNALERVATVSGEVCEGQYAGSHGAVMLQYHADGGPDVVARYRPWEGGICADAALQYLIGEAWDAPAGSVALTPHLPNGWGSLAARGLKCGGQPYDLEVRDFGWRRLERVTNRSAKPLIVDLGASVNGYSIGAVRLDGQAIQPGIDAEFGRLSFRVVRTLAPGEWVDLDFEYVP